ncbi:MAG: hypothetical protein OHK0047_28110 [Leptolyngbyaceae cyanobacterium]
MNQANELDVLRQVYGAGIHLYHQGVMYEGWFLVPIDWGGKSTQFPVLIPAGINILSGIIIPTLGYRFKQVKNL